jgi:hypothetical protein
MSFLQKKTQSFHAINPSINLMFLNKYEPF